MGDFFFFLDFCSFVQLGGADVLQYVCHGPYEMTFIVKNELRLGLKLLRWALKHASHTLDSTYIVSNSIQGYYTLL